jgi:hypothetical protein
MIQWGIGLLAGVIVIAMLIIFTILCANYKASPVFLQEKPADFYDRLKFKLDRVIMDNSEEIPGRNANRINVYDAANQILARTN